MTFVLDLFFAGMSLAALVLLWHLRRAIVRQPAPPAPPVSPKVAVTFPTPQPPPPDLVTLTLLSERGRILRTTQVERKNRRATFQDERGHTYVCESGKGARWVYRRVGRDRS